MKNPMCHLILILASLAGLVLLGQRYTKPTKRGLEISVPVKRIEFFEVNTNGKTLQYDTNGHAYWASNTPSVRQINAAHADVFIVWGWYHCNFGVSIEETRACASNLAFHGAECSHAKTP